MIREARFVDIPAIAGMLREMFAASKYLGRGEISEKAMELLLTGAIAQQRPNGPQASLVIIAEHRGKPVGFMIGVFDRVYSIGNKLTCNDLYLYVRPGTPASATLGLVDRYIAWASACRQVIEIMLSWSDAIPGAERLAALFKRKGAAKVGEMYEIRLDIAEEMAA